MVQPKNTKTAKKAINMQYKQQPLVDDNEIVQDGYDVTQGFISSANPQDFLGQYIGKAGNTRPGGMLIGADKFAKYVMGNQ